MLHYIIKQIEAGGGAPTIREIGNEFGISSTGSVRDILRALTVKGCLVQKPAKSRGSILNPAIFKITVTGKERIKIKPKKKKSG